MMLDSQAHINQLGRAALLISVFIHLLIIRFLSLTFSIGPVPLKPYFIFFGSILENRDFSELETSHKSAAPFKEEGITIAYSPTYFNPLKITSVTKPGYLLSKEKGDKTFSKTTFLDKNDEQNKLTTHQVNDLYLPPIVPLRLHIRRW